MKAPLTLAIITAGEPTLEAAVASVRDHVAEIVIVSTAARQWQRNDEIAKLADRFALCPECLDEEDHIADFSVARNVSWKLATQEWIGFLDSDDVLDHPERLDSVLGRAAGYADPRLVFPYQYAHDPMTGETSVLQMRERIVRRNEHWHWRNPVHENLVRADGAKPDDQIVRDVQWIHRRKETARTDRNLRILQRYGERNDVSQNAWYALNFGLELYRAGRFEPAARWLERYVGISGWDEERAMAMLVLSDVHMALDPGMRGDTALWWARKAANLRSGTFAPLYQLAKLYTIFGTWHGDESAIRDGVRFALEAAATPPDNTPLATQPLDRTYHVWNLIRTNAGEWLQDWPTALEATKRALESRPNDGPMLLAKRRYEAVIRLETAEAATSGVSPFDGGRDRRGLDIIILCGATAEEWTPLSAARNGIGGSETAVIEMAKRLVSLGHTVRVYCHCGGGGLFDGVEYTSDLSKVAECEVAIAWRSAGLLDGMPARIKLIWAHDVGIAGATTWTLHLADRVLALSNWHAAELVRRHGEQHGLTREKIWVTRNGIDPARFLDDGRGGTGYAASTTWDSSGRVVGMTHGPRDTHKAIYSSSPDRGLEELLDVWPAIRAKVPDASLHVFYGAALLTAHAPEWAKRVDAKLRAMAPHGVVDRGRVNQAALAREMLSAGCWLFPSWHQDRPWTETSCISAIEAQAAGLRIVCGHYGALPETVLHGLFVHGDMRAPDVQARFVELSVQVMVDQAGGDSWRGLVSQRAREAFDWDNVAKEWDRMLRELVESKREAA